jgi:RND family efflux transporter MFP subunit
MARETVAQAASAVEEARTFLGFTEIRSPVTGRVISRGIDPGSMANPGMPLLSVEPGGQYRIELPVDVSMSGLIKVGTRIRVIVEAVGIDEEVSVSEIVPTVDPMSRTFTVKAALASNEGLRSGLYAKGIVKVGKRMAILVPESAIVHRGQLDGVFVLMTDTGHLKFRIVKPGGRIVSGSVEVLSGLGEGEKIVVRGADLASDGVRVDIPVREDG